MNKNRLSVSISKTINAFTSTLPIILGMLLLTSLIVKTLPAATVSRWFHQSSFIDVIIGASAGSIAAGHPVASYLLGGELLDSGVSMIAVTALIVSWVTVGFFQLPAEMLVLGTRFAIYRNLTCFVSAIAVAYLTVYTIELLT